MMVTKVKANEYVSLSVNGLPPVKIYFPEGNTKIVLDIPKEIDLTLTKEPRGDCDS